MFMPTQLITRPIKTSELTVTSNITSLKVVGGKVSRLLSSNEQEESNSNVHLTFDVKYPQELQSLLDYDGQLAFILNLEDAAEIGLLLAAMGIENKSGKELDVFLNRLSSLVAEFE